jgi:predicted metal-dependent peptidase
MNAYEKMQESRRRIMLKHGEFNPVVLRLELVEDDGPLNVFKTGYTDGKRLAFHPEFVDKLDPHQCDTFQLHEALHVALLHTFSQRVKWLAKKDQMLMWEACDHVVNNILVEGAFKPIKPWVCDTKYQGWTVEAVFEDLKKNGKSHAQGFDIHLEPVDEAKLTSEEKAAYEKAKKEWQKALADVVAIAKQKGTLGASLEKLVNETLESVIPWPQILIDNLTRRLGHMDYTWQRPSRRGRSMDLYLPSSYDQQIDCVVFCFDTSGSMWDDPLLSQAFSEMKACCRQLKVKKVVLIEADIEVCREREVDDATMLSTDIKGGGGTSFKHALEAASKHEPNLICYFTDLYGDFPLTCEWPVLWVSKTKDVDVPFGELLLIK